MRRSLAREFNVSPRTARRYLAEWRSLAEPAPAANGNGAH